MKPWKKSYCEGAVSSHGKTSARLSSLLDERDDPPVDVTVP